jgi:hypothetical protein
MCESEITQCAVCLGELGEKNRFITECGHTFCGTCIIENLHHSAKCPMCRGVLDKNASRLRGGEANSVMTDDEAEHTAGVLISAMNSPNHLAKKIFDALPTSDWETLPDNIQTAIKEVIHNDLIQFAMDFHQFANPPPDEGPPPLEESDSDDDLYAPLPERPNANVPNANVPNANVPNANVPNAGDRALENLHRATNSDVAFRVTTRGNQRQNTIISRPQEITDPTIDDMVRQLDLISDEIHLGDDIDTIETDDSDLPDLVRIIDNNTIINHNSHRIRNTMNFALINWERMDIEPIPNID